MAHVLDPQQQAPHASTTCRAHAASASREGFCIPRLIDTLRSRSDIAAHVQRIYIVGPDIKPDPNYIHMP